MIAGLDSAAEPNAAAIAAAEAAGIRIWSGYISTAPYDGYSHYGLWHPWSQSTFEACKALGSTPIAYASGNDSPTVLKALAASWGVRLCLDVENGIRGDGPWVQSWLDASGAGLYGNGSVHNGRTAPFHILSGYPTFGDPYDASWNTAYAPRPVGPCGWQWAGSHTQFGITVDSTWFDDAFGGLHGGAVGQLSGGFGTMDDQAILDQFNFLSKKLSDIGTALQQELAAVKADVDAIKAAPPAVESAEPKTVSGTFTGTLS